MKNEPMENKLLIDRENDVEKYKANSQENNETFVYREGGFGWIVVLATGYSFGVLIGMVNNYALIMNEIDRVYNETEHHVLYAGI
jgi:hypothetical protein